MKQTFLRALVGLALGTCLVVLGSCGREPGDGKGVGPLNEHDEPIIIENGSVIVDLNPRDSKDTVGDFFDTETHQIYVRGNSDPVERIRIWKKSANGSFDPTFCKGSTGDCDAPKGQPSELKLTLTNKQEVLFYWGAKKHSGVLMFSQTPRFARESLAGKQNPHRIKSKPHGDPHPKVDKVEFNFGQKEVFERDKDGDIRIQLCTTTAEAAKCQDYDPNKPKK